MTTLTFETFNTIEHVPLRVYNRVVFLNNILSDFGRDAVKRYIEMFNEGERQQMFLMQAFIKAKGAEAAKKFATKDLRIAYDASEE